MPESSPTNTDNAPPKLSKRFAQLLFSLRVAFGLGYWWATVCFWGATVAIAVLWLGCPYPPMIDYPQHVAMGTVLHDLFLSGTAAHDLYQTNLFTYNGGIEVGIALLSFVMSPETAGKALLAGYVFFFASAVLALLDFAERPRWYGLLLIPLIYSHVVGWGFANFVLASPFIILVSVWWMRLLRGERRTWLIVSSVIGSMLVAYTHVLAMLMICVVVAVAGLEFMFGLRQENIPWSDKLRALALPAIVLVPSVGYSLAAWFWARATSTTVWENSWAEGQDDPAWQKLWSLAYNATGNFTNNYDQHIVMIALGLGLLIWWLGRRQRTHRQMFSLALTFLALYVFIPKVFIATFHIYVRFLTPAFFFLVASLPVVNLPQLWRYRRSSENHTRTPGNQWLQLAVGAAASLVAVVSAADVVAQSVNIPGVRDGMDVIDSAPEGRTLIGVTFAIQPATLHREIWVHLPALYQVRRHGVIAYSFMRNESVPVHYRPGREPPRPPGGFEWNGRLYDVRADYARAYDLVFVHLRNPERPTSQVMHQVFGAWAGGVKLLSRRRGFLLFDISELNERLRGPKP